MVAIVSPVSTGTTKTRNHEHARGSIVSTIVFVRLRVVVSSWSRSLHRTTAHIAADLGGGRAGGARAVALHRRETARHRDAAGPHHFDNAVGAQHFDQAV